MSYTITRNPAFNSLEITFTEKPSEAIRDALKALRFRWRIPFCFLSSFKTCILFTSIYIISDIS